MDFLSTHTYGVEGAFDEFGEQMLALRPEKDALINDIRAAKKRVLSSKMPNLPIHYTEWSSSYSPRDPIHDTYLQAPYILHNLNA